MKSEITKEQQIKELVDRVPPVANVDVVVVNQNFEYLIGRRAKGTGNDGSWQFAGGRMKYTETLQEAANRILVVELPGINAALKKLITVISTIGDDPRANGITIYYLYEYKDGKPQPNEKQDDFKWVSKEQLLKEKRVSWFNKSVVDEIDAAVRTMNTTDDEIIVEVDENDNEIGTIVKREAHNTTERYHRAAHIMIFDSKGNVILQKRAKNKLLYPNWWDMAGGHQAFGQTIEQAAAAETSEELGITPKLVYFSRGLYHGGKQSEWYHLFYGISDGPYGYDKNEVAGVQVFEPEKLLSGKYENEYQIMPHVIRYTNELREVWEPLRKEFQAS